MMFETPRIESFDIDTPVEWTISEIVSKYLTSAGR
jgi:CMP-N-acetylneuraminic acid synthetase